jgi:hypothetical protein
MKTNFKRCHWDIRQPGREGREEEKEEEKVQVVGGWE